MRLRDESLPWLEDEPPARAVPAARRTSTKALWPWYLLFLLLIAAVVTGAWWLSTGKEAAPPTLPAEQSLPIPVNPSEPAPAAPVEPLTEDTPTVSADPAAQIRTEPPRTSTRTVQRPSQRVTEAARSRRGIFPADEPSADAPPVAGPAPIILYHPQPNRGRVVQLGAFPTRAQADDSWKRIARRYPYLATKPKMVNTVDVRALGGGRPTRMYRLQLGTSSQAQSVVICQQLDRAGHSCVVVY
jgi:hypothetical protein